MHCVKCCNFTQFHGVEILWKGTVSSEFRAIRPKLCGNYVFPQNFHTMKLGGITAFYAALVLSITLTLSVATQQSFKLYIVPYLTLSFKWMLPVFPTGVAILTNSALFNGTPALHVFLVFLHREYLLYNILIITYWNIFQHLQKAFVYFVDNFFGYPEWFLRYISNQSLTVVYFQ